MRYSTHSHSHREQQTAYNSFTNIFQVNNEAEKLNVKIDPQAKRIKKAQIIFGVKVEREKKIFKKDRTFEARKNTISSYYYANILNEHKQKIKWNLFNEL